MRFAIVLIENCSFQFRNIAIDLWLLFHIDYPRGETKKTSKGTLNKTLQVKIYIYLDNHKVPFSLIYDYAIQWVIAECNVQ